MGLYNFLFGKITYKENQHFIGSEKEERIDLPSLGGCAYVHFEEEGARGVRFGLPRGEYALSIVADGKEHSLAHFSSAGSDTPIARPLSVTLIQRAQLVIRNQNQVEARIPLW